MDNVELEFEGIHNEYRSKILRYLDGMVGPAEAEELAQETMLKVSMALSDFRGESKLSTWIFRIATNVARDRLRSRSYKEAAGAVPIEGGDDGAETLSLPDQNAWTDEEKPAVTQKLIRGEMNHCIREVVDTLPEDYRSVILLSEFEDMKDREIAETLAISLGAVKIRLHRARAKLEKALQETCNFSRDERNEFVCERKPFEVSNIRPKK